ncbi:endoglucanase 5-like [Nymphaea colorata]|nr:endoglucanase 5-like [Nymphaea colorata]
MKVFQKVLIVVSSSPALASFDYNDALNKTLLFFEAQRSGKLPEKQRVSWRGDSALKDGFEQGVDLVGGYYDGGGHVKYGFPMAFTMTILSWGAVEYAKELTAASQLEYTLEAIRWGTDYLIKAHNKPDILWAQVGNGESDHFCWQRAEDMTTPRTAYKLDSNSPGSDLAAETAAAMAAASIAFKPYDSRYSQLLLLHAQQLFDFADEFRGRYDTIVTVAQDYYPSTSGYMDELLWAAAWLFRASGDAKYLKYVVDNANEFGGTGMAVTKFDWDNKYAGIQILLSKLMMDGQGKQYNSTLAQFQDKAEYFLCANLQKNNGYDVDMTPGGLLFVDENNNMQYASVSAFLLAVYSDYLLSTNAELSCADAKLKPMDILTFAQSQADYILGKNPKSMSYLVGFGATFPTHLHHRDASIESIKTMPDPVGCVEGFESWFKRNESDPNLLAGALVGGPDRNDSFMDERWNHEQTEPTTYSAAPLVGLFAKLNSVFKNSGNSTDGGPQTSSAAGNHSKPAEGEGPVTFVHSVTNSWRQNETTMYRHRVVVKNVSGKTITELKLQIEGLTGHLWGLQPADGKNVFTLPKWLPEVKPEQEFDFVYVQEGPQAHISVLSCN